MSRAQTATPESRFALAALELVRHGLSVLPAARNGDQKHVALSTWKEYQSRLPSHVELGRWFGHPPLGNAMCVVCGAVSGNLEVIDFDLGGESFRPWCEAVSGAAPGLFGRVAIQRTPSGGFHAAYRCSEQVSPSAKLAQRRIEAASGDPLMVGAKVFMPRRDAQGRWHAVVTMIETRGEGGLVLCAPSPGYEPVQGTLADLPILSADERDILLSCARALNEVAPPVVGAGRRSEARIGEMRPGDEFNTRGDPRPVLLRHGWTLARAEGADGNEHWTRPGKPGGTSATLKDRVLYVFSTNAPPFEPGKGYSPFAVHALLEHHGDFAAAARALSADGYGSRAVQPKADISAILPAPATPESRLPPTVRELVARHPSLRAPVIHRLLREGETMNVIAAPKTGKSWLANDLAIAVAAGRPWLGSFVTERGKVLIIDNELHAETSAHRIPKVAAARGIPMRDIEDAIHVENVRGRLMDIGAIDDFLGALAPGHFKVVVIDAFYRIMPAGGDENDNGTMAGIYNRIDAIAARLQCCFVLIHHSSKGSQSGKSVTDVGAGAGAQSRATDTHLVLRPHEERGAVALEAAVRSWQPIEPVCLRWTFPVWDVADDLDPRMLHREQRGGGGPGARRPAVQEWTVDHFVEGFLKEPRTREEIVSDARVAGLSQREAKRLISLALATGQAHQEQFNGRSAPRLVRGMAPVTQGEAP